MVRGARCAFIARPALRTAPHAKAQGQTDGAAGTPLVLPRPDYHFQGNVGRTYLDSAYAQPQSTAQPVRRTPRRQ